MNKHFTSLVIGLCSTGFVYAQSEQVQYINGDKSPHQSVWYKVEQGRTNVAFVELASGLNRLEGGRWIAAEPTIQPAPGAGGAVGTGAQHEVRFAANLNSHGAIQLKTPEGRPMRSHVVGLAYQDLVNGGEVLIAEVKDCQGYLVGNNQVIYKDAFEGVKADVRYTYSRDGFEQDIVLLENPAEPELFGMDPETTDLLVLTEFVEVDEPARRVEAAQAPEVVGLATEKKKSRPRVPDEELEFGTMKIGHGQAFKMDNGERKNTAPVNKQWAMLDGRRFLIERITHGDLLRGMGGAKPQGVALNAGPSGLLNQVRQQLSLPAVKVASANSDNRQMVRAYQGTTEGYVIDYYLGLVSSSTVTLRGDTTYLVSGPVTLSGTTTIEGGTVVKYAKNVNAALNLSTVVWKTDPYRPAIFTAKDDNTVGEEVPGSTGAPVGTYALTALSFSSSPQSVRHVRISRANIAISVSSGVVLDLRHAQILDCNLGVYYGLNYCCLYAGNVLFHRVTTAFEIGTDSYYSLTMEHITFRSVGTCVFADFLGEHHTSSTIFRNCLFSSVGAISAGGGCGGCCGCCGGCGDNMGVELISCYQGLTPVAFVAVGGASNYLANPNLYPGTTAINASLLTEIKTRTEYAPTVVTTPITTTTVWPMVVLRDSDATPDAGYHYAPLDYFVSGVVLRASLTLSNGVAVGLGGSAGFVSTNGGTLISAGSFVPMNRVVSYQNVHEQPPAVASGLFDPLPGNVFILFNTGTDASRQFRFRFTDLSIGQGLLGHVLRSGAAMPPFQTISFQDCWLRGGSLAGTFFPSAAETVNLVNNLILVSKVDFNFNSANMGGPPGQQFPVTLNCYNNLFKGGNTSPSLQLTYTAGSPAFGNNWNLKDNLFDGAAQTLITDTGGDARILRSNNGFITGTVNSLGGSANVASITANYQTSIIVQQRHGPLAGFYYPSSGAGTLFSLINSGSRTAPAAGLYHFTTLTNQTKESTSQVDIGFHYPAVDTLGNMLNSDQDGTADVFEDLDGDGVVDVGETQWAATISVQPTLADAWESGEDPGVYTVTRVTDNLGVSTTATIQMSGTATSGTDYPSLGTTVTIPAGLTSMDVYLWPFNDGVSESTETAVMTLIYSDRYILGTPVSATVSINNGTPTLVDPKAAGSYSFSSVVYASSGTQLIPWYMTPSANYTVGRRLDISPFYNSIDGTWGFDATSVPINGLLSVPNGSGPFPLALFVHGNHDPFDYSDPGYVYLCELLASRGIIAATIDCNFLNGWSWGENGARGIVHLEHARQFLIWNATPGHPLYGKLDTNNIMLVGHSRGGEGVGHASFFNTYTGNDPVYLDGSAGLGPYFLSLKAIVAISPVDQQYTSPGGPVKIKDNYLIFHGSRDGDVSNFEGYLTYDRAQPIDLANPTRTANGFKALGWIVGANHNYFNTTWDNEGGPTLTRTEQEDVAKVYISAMAQVTMQGQKEYLKFLKNHAVGVNWLPTAGDYVSQFQAPNRLFIDHYEEDTTTTTVSPPVIGANSASAASFSELFFQTQFPVWIFEETHGVRFEWSASSHFYQASFSGAGLNASSFGHLALRIGQSDESPNPFGADQNLRIVVQDTFGTSTSFVVSNVSQLLYPDTWFPKTVMQTIRIPLNTVRSAGVDVSRLAFVKLVFDQTSGGVVYFDEIQLSN